MTEKTKVSEHWIEVGTGNTVRMLSRIKAGSGLEGPLESEYSTDGETWFGSTIRAYQHGKANDCLLHAGDTVDQAGIEVWLVGFVGRVKTLANGASLRVTRHGDRLLVIQEQEVLEPIMMSQLEELDLRMETTNGEG